MRKLQRIFENPLEISFISPQNEFSLYWNNFLNSETGKIYQVIPWNDLIRLLHLKENRQDRKSLFILQGKLALMLLKSYSNLSDRKLFEYLNESIHYQMFCGIFGGADQPDDFKIISKIRTELAKKLNIRVLQNILTKF